MKKGHLSYWEVCLIHDSLSWKEKYCNHIQCLRDQPLHIAEASGQGHGKIQRHLLLTYQGTSALSGQASHQYDPSAPLPNGPFYHRFFL
jgi:hypothetical protein